MMLEEEKNRVIEVWEMIGEELIIRLRCKEPRFLYGIQWREGINICQARYENKHGKIKTKWLTNKPLKQSKIIISRCQWTFLPLSIIPQKRSVLSDDQYYCFLMRVRQEEGKNIKNYTAKVETLKNGTRIKEKDVFIDEENSLPFKYKYAFPKSAVSQINKCLMSNVLPVLWEGPSCAVWHRSDEGRAFYLGTKRIEGNPKIEPLLDLIRGENGNTASILIAYSCFAMLKSFYPKYHILKRNSSYFEVKRHLPKQISLNIKSDQILWAKHLIDICCGCFERLEKDKMPVIDGIKVQKIPSKLASLGISEFERKVIQPACILWVNREPVEELMQSGKVLNVQVVSEVNDDLNSYLSECLMYIIANQMKAKTNNAYEKCLDKDWEGSAPLIDEFLSRIEKFANSRFDKNSEEYEIVSEVANDFRSRKSEPIDSRICLDNIKRKIVKKIDRILRHLAGENLKVKKDLNGLKDEILREYNIFLNHIRKIQKDDRLEFYSLNSAYKEALKRLNENKSVHMMGQEIVEKIAYLQTSFQFFVRAGIPSKYQQELCDKVEASLISAYQSQLNTRPQDVIEQYILSLLETGRCARIRGKGSGNACCWYDPRQKMFLIPAKTYFSDLKKDFLTAEANKRDFETELVRANALCVVQREKQKRRTLEVVVQKGGGKMSVLKINAASLSGQFSENAHKQLAKIERDQTSYRS